MNTYIVMSSTSKRTLEAYRVHANNPEEALRWAQAQDDQLRSAAAGVDAIFGKPARNVEKPHLWIPDEQKKESEAR